MPGSDAASVPSGRRGDRWPLERYREVAGAALYVDDVRLPDTLHLAFVQVPILGLGSAT